MTALISLSGTPDASVQESGVARLEILHGLHQGVSLLLDNPVYVIGSAAPADLVLGDADVAEQHVRLRFSVEHVAIEALGGDVTVFDSLGQRRVVNVGHGQRICLPVELLVGQSRLCLRSTRSTRAIPAVSRRLVLLKWPALAALLLLVTCATAFAFRAPAESARHSIADSVPGSSTPVKSAPTLTQARSWLEGALQDVRLTQLRVEEQGGQLSVEGAFPAAQKSSWLQIQQAFDTRFGQHIVLTPNVQASTALAAPRVRFQAVWFGRNPYVIDEHGKRVYPGALLPDNWRLESIEGNQVRLVRGDERFAFTL
ncbi:MULTISPECIES: SctD/MshK family protein [Pseudomonas syringae group genomosp. 2]|uniref:SMAD/FHA domain protein n=2 Tax=Pseudomonas amygdali TaxID=47877 RepID=A0A0Q0E9E2_PSEA0|nr:MULTISPECIES: FHA domain-containing protein [Pseudomonas syringae group genomosp. 2]KPZ18268.1 SMAD/FHA domain protein [Pseudomonas amygdali pv. ulmi]KWS17958.1 SMAD/FHA domain protein [Pseudomonas amygdali pv. ulmi]KWT12885.1 SMAD/FHA domain protein [Pseudomonas amygdali pv. aesculi]KWT24357.1 SMAD/FHA domain protein [Pseudomonas amygdali pv. aesculi]KWT27764.1 SMAD/FHA domain protein [Pseudomonas amygdali pv. aesculi]